MEPSAGGPMAGRVRRSVVATVIVALAAHTASCGNSSREAPYGLESLTLPEGSEQIAAVLTRMPRTLRGLRSNEPTTQGPQLGLSYDGDRELALVAMDLGTAEGGSASSTVGEFLPRFAESGEVDISGSHLEGPLLWFTGENHSLNEQGEILQTFWTMWWGAPSSGWVFAVNAASAQDGIALVEAFAETASQDR
jgi:hypothetical protein